MADPSAMSSEQRRDAIRDLLVAELHHDGVLEPGDLVTYWMTLVATHSVDEDGDDLGPVYRVLSTPEPSSSQALGLMEWQRMYTQAQITATVAQAIGDDD